jgi:hypothetical protein
MNSIDVKIANAKRRAEEERLAAQPKPRPTPEMNADDMRVIAEDFGPKAQRPGDDQSRAAGLIYPPTLDPL